MPVCERPHQGGKFHEYVPRQGPLLFCTSALWVYRSKHNVRVTSNIRSTIRIVSYVSTYKVFTNEGFTSLL